MEVQSGDDDVDDDAVGCGDEDGGGDPHHVDSQGTPSSGLYTTENIKGPVSRDRNGKMCFDGQDITVNKIL